MSAAPRQQFDDSSQPIAKECNPRHSRCLSMHQQPGDADQALVGTNRNASEHGRLSLPTYQHPVRSLANEDTCIQSDTPVLKATLLLGCMLQYVASQGSQSDHPSPQLPTLLFYHSHCPLAVVSRRVFCALSHRAGGPVHCRRCKPPEYCPANNVCLQC